MLDHETSEQEFAELVDRAGVRWTGNCSWSYCPNASPCTGAGRRTPSIGCAGTCLRRSSSAGLPEEALPYVLRGARERTGRLSCCRGGEGSSRPGITQLRRPTVPSEGNRQHQVRRRRGVVRQLPAELAAIRTHHRVAGDLRDLRLARERGVVALPALRSLLERTGVLSEVARIKLESVVSELSANGSCCAVPAASPCCASPPETARPVIHQIHPRADVLAGVELEDQDGAHVTVRGVLHRQALGGGVLLHALRQPQQVLAHDHQAGTAPMAACRRGLDGRIQTAAITYDPEFDLPARLRAYGENRGVVFSPCDRLFRTREALSALDRTSSSVSTSADLVNRHRIELFRWTNGDGWRGPLPACSGTLRTCSLRRQALPNGHDSMRRVRDLSGPDELSATVSCLRPCG